MKEGIILTLGGVVGLLISWLIPVDLSQSSDYILRFIGVAAMLCGGAAWLVARRIDRFWVDIGAIAAAIIVVVLSAFQTYGLVTGEPGSDKVLPLFIWTAAALCPLGLLWEAAGLKIVDGR